ncbi:hypothetical protein HN587_02555 [Candidatus Woesearchaeota archaeon]|jgi:hypothetical protein|nr:hypothetical protein [Candidatus Woesearchaeota archaeon]
MNSDTFLNDDGLFRGMVDLRKVVIIFVIAVLYAIFVNSLIEAVYPNPRYDSFCGYEKPRSMPVSIECTQIDTPDCGFDSSIKYSYDSNGCPTSAECNFCQRDHDAAQKMHNLVVFIVSSIFGLIAIAVGLYLPIKNNDLNEWIATGFMLGGLFTLFFGTAIFYEDMARFLRPVVILFELVLVIYLAYKKLKK